MGVFPACRSDTHVADEGRGRRTELTYRDASLLAAGRNGGLYIPELRTPYRTTAQNGSPTATLTWEV